MTTNAIEIRGLEKRFPNFTLGPIDITVPTGAIYGLIGPNGAGKTTTLDLIFGMGAKRAGSITVLGLDHLRDEVAMKQQVGYVSPDLNFSSWKTVGKTIEFVRSFYPTWDDVYCDRLLKAFNLDWKAGIGTLSFGAPIKLALLLALSWRPKVLILDEPTVGLDALPISRREFGRAVWFLGAMAPALAVVAAKLIGVLWVLAPSLRHDGASWLLFSIGYDFAYTGTLGFLWTTHAGSLTGVRRAIAVSGFVVFTALGWLLVGLYLPTTWAQVTVWHELLLALGLVLTVAGYVRSSALVGYSSAGRGKQASLKATHTAMPSVRPRGGRLSGLQRLVLRQGAVALTLMSLIVAGVALAVWLDLRYEHRPWNPGAVVALVDFRVWTPILWIPFLQMSQGRWSRGMRQLRVLPISTREMNALVLARPVITWMSLCIVMLVTRLVFAGQLPSLLDVCAYLGLLGVACLANVIVFRWDTQAIRVVLVLFIAYVVINLSMDFIFGVNHWRLEPATIQTVWTVFGVCAIIASALWLHHTLTTCDIIYRRKTALRSIPNA